MPINLGLLGDSLAVLDFLNTEETLRNIEDLVLAKHKQFMSSYTSEAAFFDDYIKHQHADFVRLHSKTKLIEADKEISDGNYKAALFLIQGKIVKGGHHSFRNILEGIKYSEKKSKPLNRRSLAVSYLTQQSNLENVDVLLANTTTNDNPAKSLMYRLKSDTLNDLCRDIHRFYNGCGNLKRIIPSVMDEIESLKKIKPHKANHQDIIAYDKKMQSLLRKSEISPCNARRFLGTKGLTDLSALTHTQKSNIIKGFLTDIKKHIFPDWISLLKEERERVGAAKAAARRAYKRKAGKIDNEEKVRRYYASNPTSTIAQCARNLNMDRKTVRKYKRKIGI